MEGTVYNVKDYAPNHPGGDHYLLERLGKDITVDFEEAEHTKTARNTFKDLPVVGVVSDDNASTSSQNSDKKKTDFGAQSLFGLKFNEKINERLNFDYTKPVAW
jgi:cytochrome b involved in lipid metabolism